jgi:hypothetical protein
MGAWRDESGSGEKPMEGHYWKIEQMSGIIDGRTTYYHWGEVHPKTLKLSRFADPGDAHEAVGELYAKLPYEKGWEFRVVKLKRGESEPITFITHGTGKEKTEYGEWAPVPDALITPSHSARLDLDAVGRQGRNGA